MTKSTVIDEMIEKNESFYIDPSNSNLQKLRDAGFIRPATEVEHTSSPASLYNFTPKYADYVHEQLNNVAEVTGMVQAHVEEIMVTSILNNTVIGERPVNLSARALLEDGAMGKPLTTKGKSSAGGKGAHDTHDPTAGYIPYDQSMSKIDSRNSKEIDHFQHKVDDSIDRGDAERIHLQQTVEGKKLTHYVIKNEDGSKDFIYNKEGASADQFFCKRNGKEELYALEGKEPQPLYVMGEKVDGVPRPYTADYDALVYAPQVQREQNYAHLDDNHYRTLVGDDHYSENIGGGKVPGVYSSKGFVTDQQEALSTALQSATQGATSHGADTANPVSFKEELQDDLRKGVVMFSPDGRIDIIKSEQGLADYMNNAREEGYSVTPNPRWGWQLGDDGKFTVPAANERTDWKHAFETIEGYKELGTGTKETPADPGYQARYDAAKPIYELTMQLKDHEYRAGILGENYGVGHEKPGYITSANAAEKRAELAHMEKAYLADFNENSPSYQAEHKAQITFDRDKGFTPVSEAGKRAVTDIFSAEPEERGGVQEQTQQQSSIMQGISSFFASCAAVVSSAFVEKSSDNKRVLPMEEVQHVDEMDRSIPNHSKEKPEQKKADFSKIDGIGSSITSLQRAGASSSREASSITNQTGVGTVSNAGKQQMIG